MLAILGAKLAKSPKRRRLILVLTDNGPDDMKEAGERAKLLLARGILPIHLLVGVHGTPHIYPIELIYSSMNECLTEFGQVIVTALRHMR